MISTIAIEKQISSRFFEKDIWKIHNKVMGTNKLQSYPLRMEQDLREKLDSIAKENGRSMNAEIVHRLEESFEIADLKERLEKERQLRHVQQKALDDKLQEIERLKAEFRYEEAQLAKRAAQCALQEQLNEQKKEELDQKREIIEKDLELISKQHEEQMEREFRQRMIEQATEGGQLVITSAETHALVNRLNGIEGEMSEIKSHFADFMKMVSDRLNDREKPEGRSVQSLDEQIEEPAREEVFKLVLPIDGSFPEIPNGMEMVSELFKEYTAFKILFKKEADLLGRGLKEFDQRSELAQKALGTLQKQVQLDSERLGQCPGYLDFVPTIRENRSA